MSGGTAEVVTNLLDEIIEIYEWRAYDNARGDYNLRGRGHVRAVYLADKDLMVLVEHDLGYESRTYSDRAKDGGFETYSLHQGRVRAVQRCARCIGWDQKSLLVATYPGEGLEKAWEHKNGEGCKKVGHGG